jgi:hypothetical protein
MLVNDEFLPILDEVDLLVAEMHELHASGPHFRIYHRFHRQGTVCAPGEEILAICFIHRGKEYHLKLSLALRILFDYLARHSRFPQSATQIEAGIRASRFYTEHGASIMGRGQFTRSIPRTCVKVYVERLRSAIENIFREAGFLIDARAVLLSERTVMSEVDYRLRAGFEWVHLNA